MSGWGNMLFTIILFSNVLFQDLRRSYAFQRSGLWTDILAHFLSNSRELSTMNALGLKVTENLGVPSWLMSLAQMLKEMKIGEFVVQGVQFHQILQMQSIQV